MKKSNLKVMTVIGTRPEIIRLSRTMSLLDEHLTQVIVHTGQNYDYELNEVFFNDLELRKPDHFMNIDTTSLGTAVGDIIRKSEEVMKLEKPDALLVLGDTNSCLSAYMAKRLHIPIFHMEAGNRSFDLNVPEEINRRIIDHIADFNLVYTEHARRHREEARGSSEEGGERSGIPETGGKTRIQHRSAGSRGVQETGREDLQAGGQSQSGDEARKIKTAA